MLVVAILLFIIFALFGVGAKGGVFEQGSMLGGIVFTGLFILFMVILMEASHGSWYQ